MDKGMSQDVVPCISVTVINDRAASNEQPRFLAHEGPIAQKPQ
jgi:hypothetical protein